MIGVARTGWAEEQFVERARRSLEDHRILDEARFGRFSSRDLRKIDVQQDGYLPTEASGIPHMPGFEGRVARTIELAPTRFHGVAGFPYVTTGMNREV